MGNRVVDHPGVAVGGVGVGIYGALALIDRFFLGRRFNLISPRRALPILGSVGALSCIAEAFGWLRTRQAPSSRVNRALQDAITQCADLSAFNDLLLHHQSEPQKLIEILQTLDQMVEQPEGEGHFGKFDAAFAFAAERAPLESVISIRPSRTIPGVREALIGEDAKFSELAQLCAKDDRRFELYLYGRVPLPAIQTMMKVGRPHILGAPHREALILASLTEPLLRLREGGEPLPEGLDMLKVALMSYQDDLAEIVIDKELCFGWHSLLWWARIEIGEGDFHIQLKPLLYAGIRKIIESCPMRDTLLPTHLLPTLIQATPHPLSDNAFRLWGRIINSYRLVDRAEQRRLALDHLLSASFTTRSDIHIGYLIDEVEHAYRELEKGSDIPNWVGKFLKAVDETTWDNAPKSKKKAHALRKEMRR